MATKPKSTRGGARQGAGRKPLADQSAKRIPLGNQSVHPDTPHKLAHLMLLNGLTSIGRTLDWLVRDIEPDA